MTLQYTEHPTPKIWLICTTRKGSSLTKEALSKCERIGVVNFYDTELKRSMYDFFNYGKGMALKDGDTFEIDDEKVSVEIKTESCNHTLKPDEVLCSRSQVEFPDCCGSKRKIATLKLKETVKEEPESIYDKILSQWEKDYGSVNTPQTMDAYTMSGFIQQVLKSNSQITTQGKQQ